MVKEVKNKSRGERVHPLGSRGLALLLAFIISFAFPFEASAKTSKYYGACYTVVDANYERSGTNYRDYWFADCGVYGSTAYLNKYLYNLNINIYFDENKNHLNASLDLEDVLQTYFSFGSSGLFNYMNADVSYYVYFGGSNGYGNYLLGTETIKSGHTQSFTSPSCTSEISVSDENYISWIKIVFDNISVSGSSPVYSDYTSFTVNDDSYLLIQDADTGLLKSIIDWLSNILDGIKNIVVDFSADISSLGSTIGNFFNSLGDSISGFFSDLWKNLNESFTNMINNLSDWFTELRANMKAWFESVGDWFGELGDRINGFFEVLLNGIKEFFEYLFKPSDDFFEKLQEELDEYLTEHLGAVYQVPEYLISELTTMYEGLSAASDYSLIITMPDISFTLHDNTYTLCDSFSYDLLSSVNGLSSKDMILTALNLGRWLITFGLAVGLTKMVYKRIINKVGVEGGDEL